MANDRTPAALGRADVRRCGTLWVATPDDMPRSAPHPPAGARIRAATVDDTAALRQAMIAAGADKPELAEVRVHGGRLGYLVEQVAPDARTAPGTVLAYGWIARVGDQVDDLGFSLEMPPGEGWIYDCATIPEARGRGLYTALLRAMRAEFPARGLEHGWIGTEPRNWASQRGIARAGFQKVADVDWSDDTAVMYGAPGFPEVALHVLAMAMGDGEHGRVLPDAGIPWIEALSIADAGVEPDGLRAFRATYGEQIHWTRRNVALSETSHVILRRDDAERAVPLAATFEEYARALEQLAPGLPWMTGEPSVE